jgi:hypothetical protein
MWLVQKVIRDDLIDRHPDPDGLVGEIEGRAAVGVSGEGWESFSLMEIMHNGAVQDWTLLMECTSDFKILSHVNR